MRKVLACAVFGFSLLALLSPRQAAAQRWDGRLYGGWSKANFYGGSKMLGSEDRNGLIIGAAAEYIRLEGDVLGFEFGVAYLQKGAQGTIEPNAMDPEQPPIQSTFDGETKLDYVEMSLIFNVHLGVGDKSEVKLGIGPALGLLTSAKAEGTVDGDPVEADIKEYLSSIDVTVVLSAGFAYAFEKFTLGLDIRSDFGAMSIDDTVRENDLKTQHIGLVLGVTVPLAQ